MSSTRAAASATASDVGAVDGPEQAEHAMAAVHVGLWVSAVRCLLTYVVAPALGALGLVLGPLGLLLQVAGTVTAVSGARRLWRLGHRARAPYAAVALALCLLTLSSLAQLLLG